MSEVRNFFLGRGEFKSLKEIIEIVRQSPKFDRNHEDAASAEALLIFQTSKQQTWLVATRARLYCILDDLRRSSTRVQWVLSANDLVAEGNITAPILAKDKNQRTGLLNVGPRRNWLFSKKLFANTSAENQVKDLIRKQMLS
jgi:hypothetical protein